MDMSDSVIVNCELGGCDDHPDILSEAHECPCEVDVNNNSEYKCYCCPDCTTACAQDI